MRLRLAPSSFMVGCSGVGLIEGVGEGADAIGVCTAGATVGAGVAGIAGEALAAEVGAGVPAGGM